MSQRFGRGEQFIEIEHAQQARPAERRVVDGVRPGQCTGVGRRRASALGVTTGLDDNDWLDARRSPRRGHELPHVADRLDVKQDGARVGVECEVIEQVAEVDVEIFARSRRWQKIRRCGSRPIRRGAVEIAPDCEISARSPLCGRRDAKLAFRLMRGIRTPSDGTDQPQACRPRGLRDGFRDRTRCRGQDRRRAPSRRGNPRAPALLTTLSRRDGGRRDDGEIGCPGISLMSRSVLMPSISECLRLTTSIRPLKPPASRLRSVVPPTDAGFGLPPTSAIERGAKRWSRR